MAVPTSTIAQGSRITSEAIFISKAPIFLPRYSGVRPTISPDEEDGHQGEGEHAVEPRTDAAEDDLAQLHQPHRGQPAQRHVRVVHRVDRAVGGGRRRHRPERRVGDPEADLLALHVSRSRLVHAQRGEHGVASAFRHDGQGEHGERSTTVMAARIAQPCLRSPTISPNVRQSEAGISRIASDLQEVRQRRRVLQRVRRVDVEEPASVGAELLDRHLRGRRADGDPLGRHRRSVRRRRVGSRSVTSR